MIANTTVIASVTITVSAIVVVYTDVRCPTTLRNGETCNRRVMSLPGRLLLDVRAHRSEGDRLGRGAVVRCDRCKALVEAIARQAA